jgi:CBS domain-containing protein
VTLGIVIVGGLLTILIAGPDRLFDAGRLSGDRTEDIPVVLVSVLVGFNLLLLGFNLVPAFPLDGGRIARAIAWRVTGDRARATRFAARLGQAFAVLLIGYGIYTVLGGDPWGLWTVMLGWLLGSAARSAVFQSAFSERLEGVTVADLMDAEPVTIPADTPAERAYEDFFLRYHGWDWFAVIDADGRLVGIAHREPLRQVAEGGGGTRPVRDLVVAPEADGQVRADAPLEVLLSSEPLRRLGTLMAVDGEGRLRGIVTLEQVARALQTTAAAG